MGLLSGVSVAAADMGPPSPAVASLGSESIYSRGSPEADVYVSDQTRSALGPRLLDSMMEWAREENPNKATKLLVITHGENLWKVIPDEFMEKVNSTNSLKKYINSRLSIVQGMPITFPLPAHVSDREAYCIIQLPKVTADPTYYAQILVASNKVKPVIEGTPQQMEDMAEALLALIAAHESAHCGHRMEDRSLNSEVDADEKGMKKLFLRWHKLFPDSQVDFLETVKILIGSRAAALLANAGAQTHMTFAGLSIPGKSYSQSDSRPLQEKNVWKISAAIADIEQKVQIRYHRDSALYGYASSSFAQSPKSHRDYMVRYQIIKALYQDGVFDGDLLQKYIAKGSLEWTERLFPDFAQMSWPHNQASAEPN